MEKSFLVITQTPICKEISNWWERKVLNDFDAKIFPSFDEAKKYMREKIHEELFSAQKEIFQALFDGYDDCENEVEDEIEEDFEMYEATEEAIELIQKDGCLIEEEEDIDNDSVKSGISLADLITHGSYFIGGWGIHKIKILTEMLLTDPDFVPDVIDNITETDDADHYRAYVCNDKNVTAQKYDFRLDYNIHKMDDENKYYYFEINHLEDEQNVCVFSARLINTENTIDDNQTEIPDAVKCEQLNFGNYVQSDNENAKKEPILWDVLDEREDSILVVSHKCLEYRLYNDGQNSSDWENSRVRKWLNGEFLDEAFSIEEKERILFSANENENLKPIQDRVFLLSKEEYSLLERNNRSALLTPLARKQYSENLGYKYNEPYGFWCLRSLGFDVEGGYDVTHVCANGSLNSFYRSDSSHPTAIRPAMWIKK